MHIKEILSQSRRDFTALYKCEFCWHEHKDDGYDDSNFHENVVPNMKCSECWKIADNKYTPRATKYHDYQVV